MVSPAILTTQISSASRERVSDEIIEISRHWADGRWLSSHNRYARNCSDKINGEKPPRGNPSPERASRQKDLRQLIAASTIGHCFDAWKYFSRSLEALSSGDIPAAIHLAYYSELRSTMSLLASEGIGVFDKVHAVVDSLGKVNIFRHTGTHSYCWEALEIWSNQPRSSHVILSCFQPEGIPLLDWTAQFSSGTSFLAKRWLSSWGIDVKRLKEDRNSRNHFSYSPGNIRGYHPLPPKETFQFLTKIWGSLEPDTASPFYLIDETLLHRSLQLLFHHDERLTKARARRLYERKIVNMLHALPFSETRRARLLDALTNDPNQGAQSILDFADSDSASYDPKFAFEVLSRTLLLVRLCTGSLNQHLSTAGIDFNRDLRFWWSTEAIHGKIWPPGDEPISFQDLWLDIPDAVQDIEDKISSGRHNRKELYYGHENSAQILTTAERAFFWSMAT